MVREVMVGASLGFGGGNAVERLLEGCTRGSVVT